MLSALEFDSSNNKLSLFFNVSAVDSSESAIVVDLNSLKDIYYPGYGLASSDYFDTQYNISCKQFYVDVSSINEISSLSSSVNEVRDSLRYEFVTAEQTGDWQFSDGETRTVTLEEADIGGNVFWYFLAGDRPSNEQFPTLSAAQNANTFTITNGVEQTITATRAWAL